MEIETLFRLIFLALFFSTLSISIYFRRKAFKSGGKISNKDASSTHFIIFRIAVFFVMLSIVVLYMVNPAWFSWSYVQLPGYLRWIGAALGLLCTALIYWMFKTIGKNVTTTEFTREGHSLVTHGPYRYVRHPLYSTGTLWHPSIFLLTANWMLLLPVLPLLPFLIIRIPNEEKNLIKTFGDEYREYMKKTGMLFPKIKG